MFHKVLVRFSYNILKLILSMAALYLVLKITLHLCIRFGSGIVCAVIYRALPCSEYLDFNKTKSIIFPSILHSKPWIPESWFFIDILSQRSGNQFISPSLLLLCSMFYTSVPLRVVNLCYRCWFVCVCVRVLSFCHWIPGRIAPSFCVAIAHYFLWLSSTTEFPCIEFIFMYFAFIP